MGGPRVTISLYGLDKDRFNGAYKYVGVHADVARTRTGYAISWTALSPLEACRVVMSLRILNFGEMYVQVTKLTKTERNQLTLLTAHVGGDWQDSSPGQEFENTRFRMIYGDITPEHASFVVLSLFKLHTATDGLERLLQDIDTVDLSD